MSRLEEIFRIEDNKERQDALVKYAQTFKINTLKARKPDGQYNENELAVLIHDAEQSRKSRKFQNVGMLVGAVFFMGIVIAAILLFLKMTASLK